MFGTLIVYGVYTCITMRFWIADTRMTLGSKVKVNNKSADLISYCLSGCFPCFAH